MRFRPGLKTKMIKILDESKIGGKTIVHRMSGSHSPFFSKPAELSEAIGTIAG
jgi:hypothetical protein